MTEAYVGEPHIVTYPEDQFGTGQAVFSLLGVLAFIATVLINFPGDQFSVFIAIVWIVIGLFFFWCAAAVQKTKAAREWQKAFMINNADLNLDIDAIESVMEHMNETTTFFGASFRHVAISVAIGLRHPDLANTTFNNCVIQCYRYAIGETDIVPFSRTHSRWRGYKQKQPKISE